MRLDRSLVINLGLVALALATALLLFLTRDRVTRGELAARPNNLVTAFRPDELESVSIAGSDSLTLQAQRTGAAAPRYLLGPKHDVEADPEAVRSFLRALELAAFVRVLDASSADEEALGLTAPRSRIHVVFRGLSGHIIVGRTAVSPSDAAYVSVRGFGDEPRLGLVREATLKELLVGDADLRPRWLLNYAPSDLQSIQLRKGDARLVLERRGPSFRHANGPRLARSVVDALLLGLSNARIVAVASRLDNALLASELLRAEFRPTEHRPIVTFELGGACPGRAGSIAFRRSSPHPIEACVPETVRTLFTPVLSSTADPALFALRFDEVESAVLERSGARLALRRSPRGFELDGPSKAEVELSAGNRFIETLVTMQGTPAASPDLEALGLARPNGSVRLVSSSIEGAPRYEEVVALGRVQEDGQLPVLRQSDGVVLLLSKAAARPLSTAESELRSRRLLNFGPSDLKMLEVELPGVLQRVRRTEDGVFELIEPAGFQHDPELVLRLVQQLGTLEADRWVTGGTALDSAKPTVKLRAALDRPAPGHSLELTVGAETSGGYFATLAGADGVFVVPKAFVHDATTMLLSRSVFIVDLGEVDAIELVAGARKLSLERDGEGFVPSRGSPEVALPTIERLLALVTNLRAEAALHTGPARPGEGLARPTLQVRFTLRKSGTEDKVLRFGSESSFRGLTVRSARMTGIDATYVISASAVREVLEAF